MSRLSIYRQPITTRAHNTAPDWSLLILLQERKENLVDGDERSEVCITENFTPFAEQPFLNLIENIL